MLVHMSTRLPNTNPKENACVFTFVLERQKNKNGIPTKTTKTVYVYLSGPPIQRPGDPTTLEERQHPSELH